MPLPLASSLDVVLLGVLGAVGLLFLLAHFTKIPYPIWLTVGGATLGFVPGVPPVELEPELVLVLFLPPLLTSAAYYSSIRDLRFNARPIALLSGRYEGELVRKNGKWLFARRVVKAITNSPPAAK